ncbi:hypothetical protein [Chelativorans sp.]|uniref:hypothetical protein n=1 Tax=Chelativorans sp. TaxID=2203393 RepID=UPI0028118FB5|nr:hypothetical protein [Chelativorans sp.]
MSSRFFEFVRIFSRPPGCWQKHLESKRLNASTTRCGVVAKPHGGLIDEKTVSRALALSARISVMFAYRKGKRERPKKPDKTGFCGAEKFVHG